MANTSAFWRQKLGLISESATLHLAGLHVSQNGSFQKRAFWDLFRLSLHV